MNQELFDGVLPGATSTLPVNSAFECNSPFTGKVFASPFRLVFKRVEDQALTWIEVKTLDGLKHVIDRISKGELVPVNAYSTLDRQLWGLLAERVGFLRFAGPVIDEFNAGVQPLGTAQSELGKDMSELFGGFEPAIEAISAMRKKAIEEAKPAGPVYEHQFVKTDGVNLTPEGEEELAKLVYGVHGNANVKVKMETANAEVLLHDTEVTDSPIGDAVAEIDAQNRELRTVIGEEAEIQARLVERAAEGQLEDEEEIDD